MFTPCLSQQPSLLVKSCLLGFPPSLSPHHKSLFPQEDPAALRGGAPAPPPGNPLPPAAARTGLRWCLPRCCTAILEQKDQNVMTYGRQKGCQPLHISKKCHL